MEITKLKNKKDLFSEEITEKSKISKILQQVVSEKLTKKLDKLATIIRANITEFAIQGVAVIHKG